MEHSKMRNKNSQVFKVNAHKYIHRKITRTDPKKQTLDTRVLKKKVRKGVEVNFDVINLKYAVNRKKDRSLQRREGKTGHTTPLKNQTNRSNNKNITVKT